MTDTTSYEEAQSLLKLPKKILLKDKIKETIDIENEVSINRKFVLISEEQSDCEFLWEITQSEKNNIRISFHHQDNNSKLGLVRIDYNSGHKNPEELNEFVPDNFKPFAGKHFDNNEHHIHYHVQGYKTLSWAIPLAEDDFPVKKISNDVNFYPNLENIIQAFAQKINLRTQIKCINFNKTLL